MVKELFGTALVSGETGWGSAGKKRVLCGERFSFTGARLSVYSRGLLGSPGLRSAAYTGEVPMSEHDEENAVLEQLYLENSRLCRENEVLIERLAEVQREGGRVMTEICEKCRRSGEVFYCETDSERIWLCHCSVARLVNGRFCPPDLDVFREVQFGPDVWIPRERFRLQTATARRAR
jgi:hypothetical protein